MPLGGARKVPSPRCGHEVVPEGQADAPTRGAGIIEASETGPEIWGGLTGSASGTMNQCRINGASGCWNTVVAGLVDGLEADSAQTCCRYTRGIYSIPAYGARGICHRGTGLMMMLMREYTTKTQGIQGHLGNCRANGNGLWEAAAGTGQSGDVELISMQAGV
ncbi:hypothetical protein BO71DRAFT_148126 [Aspergillus ellipticus CBS 707.79]|uniref:Uncharacterized protein n=1 Tax=Aspergillus ellipticus CBS 707.79 TaxID=1448320 RepID=A0A319CSH5_9EURO|nr:hypothetical protein BO71DRAFT_148126 [Aspergillus ellipticus CBS 707.79]